MRIVDWSSGVGSSVLTVTELFTTRPMQQPRPWPRAILPGLPAQDAFTVGYGGMAQEQHPFHPFEPRVELQPAPAAPPPVASGPRCPRVRGPRLPVARRDRKRGVEGKRGSVRVDLVGR